MAPGNPAPSFPRACQRNKVPGPNDNEATIPLSSLSSKADLAEMPYWPDRSSQDYTPLPASFLKGIEGWSVAHTNHFSALNNRFLWDSNRFRSVAHLPLKNGVKRLLRSAVLKKRVMSSSGKVPSPFV